MSVVAKLFTYAKLVLLLVARMVVKLFQMGTTRFTHMSRHLLASRVELAHGEQQLLGAEEGEDGASKDLHDDRVSLSEEDLWEAGGRDLLDGNGKRSREASDSSTEDELIELSDGEELPTAIAALYPAKRAMIINQVSTPAL